MWLHVKAPKEPPISNSKIGFFVSYIFIVYLFDVTNICVSLDNFGQTLRWFDSSRFLK